MKKFIQEIYSFYSDPKDARAKDLSIKNNIRYILYVLLIDIMCFIIILPMLHYLFSKNIINEETSNIIYKENTLLYNILLIGLLIPFVEEILFRFPLRYNKIYNLIISKTLWNILFKILVYLVPVVFGLVHLSNYNGLSFIEYIIYSPILVGSQLIGGYLYTFLRVRFNFLSALISHSAWNLLFTIIMIPINYFESPYIIENNKYKLIIKSNEYSNIDKQSLSIDTLNNKIFFLSSKEYSINHLMDSVFSYKRDKADFIIDIYFKSDKGIKKQKFIEIINEYK